MEVTFHQLVILRHICSEAIFLRGFGGHMTAAIITNRRLLEMNLDITGGSGNVRGENPEMKENYLTIVTF